jgi:hypothetical protein
MCATWVNIAFSCDAIAQLAGKADAAAFGDQSFRQGLAERSTYLGDPTRPSHPGHRSRWVVGGPKYEADILVIVAADDPEDLVTLVRSIKGRAAASGLSLLFEQRGDTLPGRLRGHEHFGFKDGVSQPGVRGKVSAAPGDFITPRYIDHRSAARFFPRGPSAMAGAIPVGRAAAANRAPLRLRTGGDRLSALGGARLVSRVPSLAPGCSRFLEVRHRRGGCAGHARAAVRVDAGGPLAKRRADHAHAGS